MNYQSHFGDRFSGKLFINYEAGKDRRVKHYYYHQTSKENAKEILEKGLEPRIGERSRLNGETDKYIYLSNRKDVPYWKILINQPVTLKIDIDYLDKDCIQEFHYSYYGEYFYDKYIPKEAISIAKVKTSLTEEQMRHFCLSVLNTISQICVEWARYIAYDGSEDEELANIAANGFLIATSNCFLYKDIISRMDFTTVSKDDFRKEVKAMGDGNYSFCDHYDFCNYNMEKRPRLWQLLGEHDKSTEDTKWLYHWLKKQFTRQLYIETGGWTGC